MGIHNLYKLINDLVPEAIQQVPDWSYYKDKVLAVDASLPVFQSKLLPWTKHSKTAKGENEHLMKIFYGCVRLLQHGAKPLFVFDGVAANRHQELVEKIAVRYMKDRLRSPGKERRHTGLLAEAIQAIQEGEVVDSGYKNPSLEAKQLLRLLGIPYLVAPEEAEIQCAALVKSKKVHATVTKNLDTLAFGSDRMIRQLSFKAKSKCSIREIDLAAVLKGFDINYTEFVDLCILLGCDYCDKLKEISYKDKLQLIQMHRSLENVLRSIDAEKKFKIPFFWTTLYPSYDEARRKFLNPVVYVSERLGFEWLSPNRQGIVDYLCEPTKLNKDVKDLKTCRKINKYLQLII